MAGQRSDHEVRHRALFAGGVRSEVPLCRTIWIFRYRLSSSRTDRVVQTQEFHFVRRIDFDPEARHIADSSECVIVQSGRNDCANIFLPPACQGNRHGVAIRVGNAESGLTGRLQPAFLRRQEHRFGHLRRIVLRGGRKFANQCPRNRRSQRFAGGQHPFGAGRNRGQGKKHQGRQRVVPLGCIWQIALIRPLGRHHQTDLR